MYCSQCGIEVLNQGSFCHSCGTKVGDSAIINNSSQSITMPQNVKSKLDNTVICLLAFAPILIIIIEVFISGGDGLGAGPGFLLGLAVNSGLAILDESIIKKAGYESNNLIWAIFLVPVYLWQRATITNQSRSYFWIWIVCFVIVLLLLCQILILASPYSAPMRIFSAVALRSSPGSRMVSSMIEPSFRNKIRSA